MIEPNNSETTIARIENIKRTINDSTVRGTFGLSVNCDD